MPANKSSSSDAKLVVTGKGGRGHATAPVQEMSPLRFHLRKILVPVDFSDPSRKAVRYAKVFAEQFDAKIELLHTVEPLTYPPDFAFVPLLPPDVEEKRTQEIQKQLEAIAKAVGPKIQVTSTLRTGRPWQEIVRFAKEEDVDLLVISTHGYTGLKHALLGSVAEKIVRHAPCPVLVVRDEEHDFA
jgi:nucleotide-binding universal stress UspA family protein